MEDLINRLPVAHLVRKAAREIAPPQVQDSPSLFPTRQRFGGQNLKEHLLHLLHVRQADLSLQLKKFIVTEGFEWRPERRRSVQDSTSVKCGPDTPRHACRIKQMRWLRKDPVHATPCHPGTGCPHHSECDFNCLSPLVVARPLIDADVPNPYDPVLAVQFPRAPRCAGGPCFSGKLRFLEGGRRIIPVDGDPGDLLTLPKNS